MVDGRPGRDGRYSFKFWRYTVAPFVDRPTSIPMTAFRRCAPCSVTRRFRLCAPIRPAPAVSTTTVMTS